MRLYSLALFFHIVGALGLFIALGLEWVSLWYLRRATTIEQAREWLTTSDLSGKIYSISGVAILLPGIYMMATIWGGAAWIIIALVALALMIVLGMALTGRRMAAVRLAVAVERGSLSPAFRQRFRNPLLWTSLLVRIAIGLGIIFLMTVKPALGGALLTIGVAIVMGLASALPTWRRVQLNATTPGVGHLATISEAREEHADR